jgi:hypothetical protein
MPSEDFDDLYEGIIRELYDRASVDEGPHPNARNYLVGPEGKFLGKVTSNRFDPDGIFNRYGRFGSQYSPDSIFNQYGQFGSKYSSTSPWNPYAQNPPAIYLNNRRVGVLSKNRFLPQARDPDDFLAAVREDRQFRF